MLYKKVKIVTEFQKIQ